MFENCSASTTHPNFILHLSYFKLLIPQKQPNPEVWIPRVQRKQKHHHFINGV